MTKLWGGRYQGVTDALMWSFNASIDFDRRLGAVDVQGSVAYARALERAGVLAHAEAERLIQGLGQVADEFAQGAFQFTASDEDIHTAVERRLGELVGPVAGKLHTGRSRNDQVATDIRLYLLGELRTLEDALIGLQRTIVAKSELHLAVLMPGYTHLQPAQPVRLSHWLLSYFWMLQRDRERLRNLGTRVSRCPLGSGALAGNAYGVDREALAQELGFASLTENSMDAVSDRDMILETLSWGAILGTHLSRMAEDIVLWSSVEYGFIRLNDRYTTGSSLMPQKRNPDSMELVRGKSGRLVGNLVTLLVVNKGLPSTYDKDLQEDKEPLFDTLDTLAMVLPITAGVVETMEIHEERMRAALVEGLLATDLADYLVRKGVPFREAHHMVGRAVLLSERHGVPLSGLSIDDYRGISTHFAEDLYQALDMEASVEARSARGGTALNAVLAQLEQARVALQS
jgi:argininosuccinate lyase